jgi:hypothetical protein
MIVDWMEKYQKEIMSENLDKQELIFNVNNKVKELNKYSKIVYKNFMSMTG